MGYLTVSEFKSLTIAPAAYVDAIEAAEAGWTLAQLNSLSGWIDGRLRKRYAAPFTAPVPETVRQWLAALVTHVVYLKRGVDPTDREMGNVVAWRDEARAEIKEAADSKDGLFDLPLRADTTTTGIVKGAPLGYAEASPYTWSKLQREAAEDDPT